MIIYKTTNTVNGKFYIGKTERNDPRYFGSGTYLRRAIKKYGKSAFIREIIDTATSIEELNQKEKEWIRKTKSDDEKIGYNIAEGGTGGNTVKKHSKKYKKIIKALRKGAKKYRSSSEGKLYFKQLMDERWRDTEWQNFMSNQMKGRKITWSDKISKALKTFYKNAPPRIVSAETRLKHSIATKGYEFKKVDSEIVSKIIELYQKIGPKRISEWFEKELKIDVSQYLIRRVLKKSGIYQKYQKGIENRTKPRCSRIDKYICHKTKNHFVIRMSYKNKNYILTAKSWEEAVIKRRDLYRQLHETRA